MRQWLIDAFAPAPFRGNQACVVEPFEAWPDAAWMQALAAENNQAETAFLRRTAQADRFDLRWFTPAMEVPLCGHATLASGHVLFAELGLEAQAARFATRSGELTVRRSGRGYEMDFPADNPVPVAAPPALARALGAEPVEVFAGMYVIAVMADAAAVRSLRPDIAELTDVSAAQARPGNIAVTARADADEDADVVSRFFAPGSGIAEDPATGSLHCSLSPLWEAKLGRSPLRFIQAFPGRGARIEAELRGERVLLRGEALTVLEGRLRI
ncbi:MAG TPA: PhzF family phenazine biosynthesis protein [Caulobacteraceae bacterium]|jgi:PhzF family phenazine biosynthesis protein|nr:PhzF family phenazine biosynthesis protein [Caulobacteraceae bacterium]